ncbi:23S rRNA (uracil(1939)-C(5))-methyltransferase RlmD [Salinicoccus hispanicus]|uniref:23S rRNA (Uracil(1939)-C(5))-methyltransferase RlmD n=1 Tax=Salinicoccus hispanicus TaxID=157225 RepID=A0A6N8U6G2_9STAP|nr:23S rRNA (uracil(1939)-C(5))-methyltransferase RlmD [Salinicoccus hispanicus]MXQ51911.1 23S rRNA (uracil(1939)-C(5))-methyltransferase RlmD [Salinicoccus hispanicus]
MSNQEYETHVVEIDRLDKKGSGMGHVWRDAGGSNPKKLKLNLPQTLIGETARVTVPNPDRKVARLLPDEIVSESQERVVPPCPHFEKCGGCVWQHWTYQGQLDYKTDKVRGFLEGNGFDASVVADALGMETPWEYRNKMEFTFGRDGALGLHELGNFRNIIDLDTCLIAGDEMVEAMLEVSEWARDHQLSGYDKDRHTGLLRNLMVRQSQKTGELMLAVFATEGPSEIEVAVEDLVLRLTTKFSSLESLMWMENTDWADMTQSEKTHILHGRDYINDEMYGYKYRIWFDTFFQTNPKQAEKLVELAIEMAEVESDERMIDLFCGVGTFSLPFAKRAKELAGIEIVETSIESAKRNAEDNDIGNTYFLAKDSRRGMDEILESWGRPDLLMLDPPRSGAGGKVMRRIGRLGTDRVVYVSCNPESFAEDAASLREFGYTLERVQPVDLFPHTVHVELVALFRKNDSSL